jgi:hypothetical protein
VERLVAINKIGDPNLVVAGTRLKLQAPPAPKPTPQTGHPACGQSRCCHQASRYQQTRTGCQACSTRRQVNGPRQSPETRPTEAKPAGWAAPKRPRQQPSPQPATATATATKPKVEAKPVIAAKPAQATQRVVKHQTSGRDKTSGRGKAIGCNQADWLRTKPVAETKAVVETKPVEAKPAATTVATAESPASPSPPPPAAQR